MSVTSRREFVKIAASYTAAAGFLSAGVLELHADPLGMPIGCQTWPVREMIAKDFPGTIKQLAAAGFKTIELCSPVGYADSGFAGLAKYKGAELQEENSERCRSPAASVLTSVSTNSERSATRRLTGRKMLVSANARAEP